jgi:hypothetical protein
MDPWKLLPGEVNWIHLAQDSIIWFKGSTNIGTMSDLFPGGAQFESRPGTWLSLLKFSVVFFNHFKEMLGMYFNKNEDTRFKVVHIFRCS